MQEVSGSIPLFSTFKLRQDKRLQRVNKFKNLVDTEF